MREQQGGMTITIATIVSRHSEMKISAKGAKAAGNCNKKGINVDENKKIGGWMYVMVEGEYKTCREASFCFFLPVPLRICNGFWFL